ncbi:hypothetical protein Ciccas_009818, partial [Cichlidogyrus casuarinus]
MVDYSVGSLHFYTEKHLNKSLHELLESFFMKNESGIVLECMLEVRKPFSLLVPCVEEDKSRKREQKYTQTLVLVLDVDAEVQLEVRFDPLFKSDLKSWKILDRLQISYKDHSHMDELELLGEVHYPNIQFSQPSVDFDFILNHTEKIQIVRMENISPLPVKYSWSYVIGDKPNIIFKREAKLDSWENNTNLPKLHLDDDDTGE